MKFYIGTDVGGTFTDLWVADDNGESRVFKTPTTTDVLGGVIDGVKLCAAHFELSFEQFCSNIERFGHATTVGLNALLTGTAAKTAILTTRGFGDTLEIGRLRRQTSGMNETEYTDAFLRNRFAPLVPRHLIVEIDERIDANGKVIVPLDENQARAAIHKLRALNVEALAICTLWSTHNPCHEKRLSELVQEELPGVFISLSHEVSPNVGEYGRMSTVAANAALGPVAGRYLSALERTLRDAGMKVPVLMMTCAGGVLPTKILSDRAAYALFSGPAAGVIGSRAIGAQIGLKNILATDIGGTSFDVGMVANGGAVTRSEIALAGADIRVHSIDVDSIGAGGGSIATFEFGELKVGPRSAGAKPGPACYGRGGIEPTATDADLVLGILDPNNFLGGRMKLDIEAARRAITERIAKPMGVSLLEAAWSIREVLDNRMADLLRRMTVERGYDPRDFTLFANGGAGPSHAWVLSAELGLSGFVVPVTATAVSAFGTGNSDLRFTSEYPTYVRLGPGRVPGSLQLQQVSKALELGDADVKNNLDLALARGRVVVDRFLSLRYRGQVHHLDVPLESAVFDGDAFEHATRRFNEEYEVLFGRGAAFSRAGYEILSVRVIGTGVLPPLKQVPTRAGITRVGARQVVFRDPKMPIETAIYQTTFPSAGTVIDGPAIIEFPGQSVVVQPGAKASADDFGNLHVSLQQ